MAGTYTGTTTYTRIDFIKLHFKRTLFRTTDISSVRLDRLVLGLDKQWIQKVHVYGINAQNLCRAELFLEIDWDEYAIHLSEGKTTITVDERWKANDDIAIELNESIILFNDFVKRHGLRTKYKITYTQKVYDNPALLAEARSSLGLVAGESLKWAGERRGILMSIPEASECKVGYYLDDLDD